MCEWKFSDKVSKRLESQKEILVSKTKCKGVVVMGPSIYKTFVCLTL